MEISFKGKRALVTGAGKGIGRDIAILLHQCGATVVAVSRSQMDLENLKKEIGCEIIITDLEDSKQAQEAAEKAGEVDLLVNNAGIGILEPFLDAKLENFERTININLKQVFIISQIIARGMVKKKKRRSNC